MDDDSRVIDRGWDGLPEYGSKSGDTDDAVTVSISTTPGEWLVNTNDAVVVPMSMAELVEGLRNHTLNERSLVWRAGMQEWAPVDRVPQLKLAARMPLAPAPTSAPPAPAPATIAPRPSGQTKPPPKPVRHTPHSAQPQIIPSRKSTLPFGLPTPAAGTPRASQARPSSSPRSAPAPQPSNEDSDVLAVYARPAATISFDLSPEQPLRVPEPPASVPPETLAPMTTDSAQHRAFTPRNPDLSVVAASQFREVQRSSKRWIWLSSLASAAAASLLTFWVARGPASAVPVAAAPLSEPLAAIPEPKAPEPASAAPTVEAPVVAEALGSAAPPAAPTPPAPAAIAPAVKAPAVIAARPRAPRRTKAASAAAVTPSTPGVHTDDASAAAKEPGAEPNPYDIKLEDEAAKPAKAPAPPSGLEAPAKDSEATGSGSSSPGF